MHDPYESREMEIVDRLERELSVFEPLRSLPRSVGASDVAYLAKEHRKKAKLDRIERGGVIPEYFVTMADTLDVFASVLKALSALKESKL